MPKQLTPKQIELMLRAAQERLRINNWDIALRVVRGGDFDDGRVAQCRYSIRNMSAVISVLDPRDNHDEAPGMQHMEATLYHELLHPILSPLFDRNIELDIQEQTIERIAKAIAGI